MCYTVRLHKNYIVSSCIIMEIQYSNNEACNIPKKHLDVKPQMTLKENVSVVLKDFCARTSMHGLGEVATHTIVIAKYVWFFAVLAAVCGIGYHLSTLVERFLGRPIQEITTTLNTPIPFPGITVCNLDAISSSNYDYLLLNDTSRLSKYYARLNEVRNAGIITKSEFKEFKTIISTRINIGMDESRSIGHQLSDLVLRCTFRAQPCNMPHDFKWIMDAMLYNCYTFEPDVDAENFVAAGPEQGLSLIFYLESTHRSRRNEQYIKDLNSVNAIGVKFMVHARGIFPITHIEGMEIMPGHSTSVAFQVTQTKRLSSPYGDCIHNETLHGFSNYRYSTTPCLDACLQRRFVQLCKCKGVYQPIPDIYKDDIYCGTFLDIQNHTK